MTEGLRLAVPLEEVREAVAAYAKDAGVTEPWTAANSLTAALRFDYSHAGREASAAWDKFRGQVARELNRLAEAGELVKVSAGEQTPDGRRLPRNQVRYYTPQVHAQFAQREAERRAASRDRRAHRVRIRARLAALCIPTGSDSGHIIMDEDHWDILVDLAEKGAKL